MAENAPTLEPAISSHLQVPRTCPKRTPPGYKVMSQAYCARFSPSVENIVMLIIGAQHRSRESAVETKARDQILHFVKSDFQGQPKHFDVAAMTDPQGYYNETVIAYWDDTAQLEIWRKESGFDAWWSGLEPSEEFHGWFLEIFTPTIDRVETVYSALQPGMSPEAHGSMSNGLSGSVAEHEYWGSMRDRLPASQTDELTGKKASFPQISSNTSSARIKVPGRQNLCMIRSGQDWSKTYPEERKLYLGKIHPTLIKGMNFLRDEGRDIGCYSCRFMDVLDTNTFSPDTDQTFGLAYFDDMASLEKWSASHPTHLNIFGGFLKYVKDLNFNVTLHLYHEVYVLKPEQQQFEYIGCHPKTGMLVSSEEASQPVRAAL